MRKHTSVAKATDVSTAYRWDETAGLANQINLFAALGVQKETSQ